MIVPVEDETLIEVELQSDERDFEFCAWSHEIWLTVARSVHVMSPC